MSARPSQSAVLLTGATGFVGRRVSPILARAGHRVIGTSRRPESARERFPDREFRRLDVEDKESIRRALRGCHAAVYLVHAMARGRGYEAIERRAATSFLREAEREGIERIVYLGGLRPAGTPSRHLGSRLATGEILRSGSVSTIELQATMVVGEGSESWRIVRDLAARLPFMVLPKWLESRSQPVAIDDVAFAIEKALTLENHGSRVYPLPGPDTLSGKVILQRTAQLLGSDPRMLKVPVVTPKLSSYWIRWVTRADRRIAEELVEGLKSDLIAQDDGFWAEFPDHQRLSFDEAARRALSAEDRALPWRTRIAEAGLRRIGAVAQRRRSSETGARLHQRGWGDR